MKCISCGMDGTINTKKIFFCNECFYKKFFKKVRKEVNHISENKLLIWTTGSRNSLILLFILKEIFRYRKNIIIYVYCQNYDLFSSFIDNLGFQIIKNNLEEVNLSKNFDNKYVPAYLGLAKQLGLKCLIIDENQNELAINAFNLVLNGKGNIAKDYVSQFQNDILIARPFCDINSDEIDHFYRLIEDKIPKSEISSKKSILEIETTQFINEVSKTNYSTSKNIIETLKKM